MFLYYVFIILQSKYELCQRKDCVSLSVVSNTLLPRGLKPDSFLCPCDFPGKNTGVDFHSLLQNMN